MIILLYGEDTYRQKKKLGEIMEEHKQKHKSGLNLRYLEGKSISFDDLRNEVLGISMFKEKKLVVVLDPFSNPKLKEDLLEKGEAFVSSDNVLLLVEQSKILAKDKLLAFLDKNGKTQEFELLTGVKLKNWIQKEIEAKGGIIDDSALEKLIEYVGSDLWRMENEITKLISYSKSILEKNIDLLVHPSHETNIFDTVDAIAAKNKRKAINLIKSHIEKGESAIYILAMIASQIRNIISVKGGGTGQLGMHPFVFRKTTFQAKNFSLEELKNMYARITQLDSEIKVGKIDQSIALDVLISEI
ncbi:MAG TPA: DNA polymerase III subunit delta [Candidatus Pacearchaeota archaeon]|nr:DNA polymerase III subunit delta [Candidatus Pacearchaeota archaeon]HPR79802.1 DNA polymerase III subunit delta [Candidatus Pacearchaeota archaeon]